MPYRTKTYVAADFDHDKDAIDQLYCWNDSDRYSLLDFPSVHDYHSSSDGSLYCSIKRNLSIRMKECKLFVLIVGKRTASITKGDCKHCSNYRSIPYGTYCLSGNSLSHKSYIEYECDLAVRSNLRIVVLYNAGSVDKSLCPEALRGKGIHVPMKKNDSFSYPFVRDAFLKALS